MKIKTRPRLGQMRAPIKLLPPATGAGGPTVGEIKQALHQLSRSGSGSTLGDGSASLREAHVLLRRLARRNGIDPDAAVQQQLAAVKLLRERMALASAGAPDPTAG